MTRRILFIILGALLLAVLVGLLWFWFFSGGGTPTPPGGSFGSGGNKTASTTGTGGAGGNVGSSVIPNGQGGSNTSSGGLGGTGQAGSGAGVNGNTTIGGGVVVSGGSVTGVDQVLGVEWLGGDVLGGGGGIGGGPTTSFVPKTVNQLNDGNVSGTPGIIGTFGAPNGTNGSDIGLAVGGILGAGVGCAAYAGFKAAGLAEAGAGTAATAAFSVQVNDLNVNRKAATKEFEGLGDCLTRTIAKAVLQQMTASIVNWINSGFNGQPSFVRNYEQFFTNVGDQAAGEFIKGTSLSFLCSPFQAQIRIALAQSYARRGAQACTLTGIVKNATSFMNGNFASGGWAGLLQFTTIPTNNPYGAYAYAQVGLQTAQQQALTNARNNMTATGFISLQKDVNCRTVAIKDSRGEIIGSKKEGCQKEVTTPGSVIEDSLKTSLGTSYRQLELAKSFDEIINALITQLMTKTLYNGLSTLSGTQGYAANYLTPDQQQAQNDAISILTDLQGRQQFAQQFGAAQQGAIGDIQSTQQRLQDLANCWEIASSSVDITAARQKQAQTNAEAALVLLHSYDPQVDAYNNRITRANQGIALLQDLQTRTISVSSPADVAAVRADYQAAINSGAVASAADVTQAQQDRASLQASLAIRNQQTAADLQQCHAF